MREVSPARGPFPQIEPSPTGGAIELVPSRRAGFFRAAAARGAQVAAAIGAPLVTGVSLAVWAVALRTVDVRGMDDLGLVSVLPPAVLVASILMVVAYLAEVARRSLRSRLLALLLAAVIVALYALPSAVESMPRIAVTWFHAGFGEHVMRTGTVAPELEARFNWPGFFILSAFITQIGGADNPLRLAHWAPLVFNLLYAPALLVIFRALTGDPRLPWVAILLFYLANWIGQDYFAPQAMTYLLHLTVLAIVLAAFPARGPSPLARLIRAVPKRWLRPGVAADLAQRPGRGVPATTRRSGLFVVTVLVFAAIVPSHQLTPFLTTAAIVTLILARRCSLLTLPVIMAVATAAFITYLTVPFLAGHLGSVLAEVGDVGATVGSNVTQRIGGSEQHRFVVAARLVFAVGLWLVAAVGGLRAVMSAPRDWTAVLLVVSPFPMLGLQAYGGELLLRIYLFSLPFTAFLAARVLVGERAAESVEPRRLAVPRTAVAVIAGAALVLSLMVTRYGNERVDLMTPDEVAAVERLYALAPFGSLLVGGAGNMPWKHHHYEQYDYFPVTDEILQGDPNAVADLMLDRRYAEAFLILTRSQRAYGEVLFGLPPDAWPHFESELASSPRFRLVYVNRDARIYQLVRAEEATSAGGRPGFGAHVADGRSLAGRGRP